MSQSFGGQLNVMRVLVKSSLYQSSCKGMNPGSGGGGVGASGKAGLEKTPWNAMVG